MSRAAIIVLCVALLVFLAWAFWPRRTARISGPLSELEPRIAHLMSRPGAFLIVQVAGTEDFLQLTATPDSAEIGFPLITERQQGLEPHIRQTAADMQLEVRETRGTDGSRFLDCHIRGMPAEISSVCRQLLQRVFGARDHATLTYETNANI